jgi:hypothetical protein
MLNEIGGECAGAVTFLSLEATLPLQLVFSDSIKRISATDHPVTISISEYIHERCRHVLTAFSSNP